MLYISLPARDALNTTEELDGKNFPLLQSHVPPTVIVEVLPDPYGFASRVPSISIDPLQLMLYPSVERISPAFILKDEQVRFDSRVVKSGDAPITILPISLVPVES